MSYILYTWYAGQSLFEVGGDGGWKRLASEHKGEWLLEPNGHPEKMIQNKERETRVVSPEEAAMILFEASR